MKFAKSLRFGGVFIPADKCTHESYLKLGLKCETCDSPVFFSTSSQRKEHKRKLKSGKIVDVAGSDIGAFFSHFQSKGAKQDFSGCEERIKLLKPQDFQKRETVSKNQRLKKFQDQFWKLLKFSHKMATAEEDIQFAESGYLSSFGADKPENYRHSRLEKFIQACVEFLKNNKNVISSGIKSTLEDITTSSEEEIASICGGDESLKSFVKSLTFGIEVEMQGLITQEALDFLLHKSSKPLLEKLIKKALCDLVIWLEINKNKKPEVKLDLDLFSRTEVVFDKPLIESMSVYSKIFQRLHNLRVQELNEIFRWLSVDILSILISVPWGDAFTALDNWSEDYEKQLKIQQQSSRMAGVWHYTLNTGHTIFDPFTTTPENFAALDFLSKELTGLLPGMSRQFAIPATPGFYCKVTLSRGAALFDVMQGEELAGLMVICGVAWTDEGAAECWELLSGTYEEVVCNLVPGLSFKKSVRPLSLPWLSVMLLPNFSTILYPRWLASFEQCVAQCLIGRS